MRITLVIYSLVAGGAERVMATMANYWAEKGWNVNLLTLNSSDEPPFYALHSAVRHSALGLASISKNPLQGIMNNFSRARKLRRAILETQPDAVISSMSETNVLTLLALAGSKTRVLVQEQIDPHNQPIQRHWNLLRRWIYPFATHVVTLNERSFGFFPPSVRKRGRIIPNPAVVSGGTHPPFSDNGGPKKLIAMGRLDHQKGFDMLLQAFGKIADKHPEWSLEILGEGPLRAELESLTGTLGLAGRVQLPGTTKEPFEKLRQADLFVMSSRYEGFPLSLCEAMGCGLPAISFDCPTGPGEIIRNGIDGVLVPPGNVSELGAAMDTLMTDRPARERMAGKAPEVLERFSLPRVMGLWEAALAGAKKINLFFLIRSLGNGGAERQLTELVRSLDTSRFQITVATFYDGGALRRDIEGLPGVRVVSLGKKSRWDIVPFFRRLARLVRETKPDIVHGYMGIANELALLIGRLCGARVVWGLRMSRVDHTRQGWMTIASFRIGAALSRFADLQIANSHSGRQDYIEERYHPKRLVVVSNGIDTSRFRPDEEARKRMRAEWKMVDDERLIGIVGRINPQKDHPNFLRAAAIVAGRRPGMRFVCVGDGPREYRERLERLASELDLSASLLWIPASREMTAVYNALDVSTLCSEYGEGFPNVLGEAMACGVPVVATDVGDSALVIGNPSQIVPPKDPKALAAAWERVLDLDPVARADLARAQRNRVVLEFSLENLTRKTASLLENL